MNRLKRRIPLFSIPALFVFLLGLSGCQSRTCPVAPSITGQPTAQSAVAGQSAMFTVAASGSAPLSYQWLKNGAPIQGATKSSYALAAVSPADSGSVFAVTVKNPYGSITSSSESLEVTAATPDDTRYVSPNGSDSNAGTIDAPFQTIQHCASNVGSGWTCVVRAGTYRETVTPNSGVTITAYGLDKVVIDGSDPVTGWTPYSGSIYKAHVSLRSDDTNQIFVGNEMMTEARWPNGNDLFHVNWATAQSGTDHTHIVDQNLPSVDWTGAKIHVWSGSDPFGHETGIVTASGPGAISIDIGQVGTCPWICPATGGFYYLFGTLNALDVENEWFYDSSSETLYFMAPGKVDPNTLDVRSKQRMYAVDLRGKSGVVIRNIGIFASTIIMDQASSNNTLDGIDAQYVSQFTNLPTAANDPTGHNFTILEVHEGDSGIIINGTGNTLENSTISYSAGAGVALEGGNNTILPTVLPVNDGRGHFISAGAAPEEGNNTVRNNLIQNIDYVGDYASGIDLDSNGNFIENNTIHTVGRQGIYITAVLNQDIGYNNLFDAMILSRDGGEIYSCCYLFASGLRIHHNWIHDTTLAIAGLSSNYPITGIYIDNGSTGFLVDQNILWNNLTNSIIIDGGASIPSDPNYIHNNTFPDNSSHASIAVYNIPHCNSARVEDNRITNDLRTNGNGPACVISNNNSYAPGANEMTPGSQVGCNFDGCSSLPPPAVINGGSVTPCPVTRQPQ